VKPGNRTVSKVLIPAEAILKDEAKCAIRASSEEEASYIKWRYKYEKIIHIRVRYRRASG